MKTNLVKILWGIMLIALGGFLLADALGYLNLEFFTPNVWAIVFAIISVACFSCYFLVGVQKWGWLFPALIFAALTLILGIFIDNRNDTLIAVSVLLSVGIPFYVGYILNRKQWGLLIPAWIMTIIPAIVALADNANSDLIGATVLFAIALPFIFVYLVNRHHKWALIVGAILAFIALFPLLGPILPDVIAGPVVMFLFALPFFIIYLASKKAWWAFIPAGVFSSIGIVALLATLLPNDEYFMLGGLEFGAYSEVLLLCFAATFGILWLRRSSQPTAWAKYPAIGLLIVAMLAFLMWKTASNLVPALVLLIVGVTLIVASVLKRRGHQPLTSRNP